MTDNAQGTDSLRRLVVLVDASHASRAALEEAADLAARSGAELVGLFDSATGFDRPRAIKLAESCAGRTAEARFTLTLDLIDRFLSRAARAGLAGPPADQGAAGEARLLARLAPDARAARAWATLAQEVSDRTRHGKAVNLDPALLILDTVLRIEQTAQRTVADATTA